jgi:DNA-binding MarR family transcriptional regulator
MPRDINLAETVKLLDDLSAENAGNQRDLAKRIGISVGLVNALVHRAVLKGLVKIKNAPARRYAYYLTPKGFAEKSRLVAEYLDCSLMFFRTARQEYGDLFSHCAASGKKQIVLCGAGELAEIATLAANGIDVEIACVLDQQTNHSRIAGLPVVRLHTEIPSEAVCVITDERAPQETFDQLINSIGIDQVLAPQFLRISRSRHNAA